MAISVCKKAVSYRVVKIRTHLDLLLLFLTFSALVANPNDGYWNLGFFRGFGRYGLHMNLGALNQSWCPSFAHHSSWYIRFPPNFHFKWYQKSTAVHGPYIVYMYV